MFRNPGYPATYSEAGDCEWKITKSQENICQIRLDFETMVIGDPDGNLNGPFKMFNCSYHSLSNGSDYNGPMQL